LSDDGKYKFKLTKNEILRGFDAFSKVLSNSKVLSSEFLKVYIQTDKLTEDFKKNSESPLLRFSIKVGFIIAKKRIRKSVFRNRLKRLIKESYRLRKNSLHCQDIKVNMIFTLSEKGYNYVKLYPDVKAGFFLNEMETLIPSINKFLKKYEIRGNRFN